MSETSAANQLSVTLAPLVSDASGDAIKAALDRVAALRLRRVQVAATMPGLRPRDLDRAARRDLLASLRRRELTLSGLDAWIPLAHFADATTADRAVQAVMETIALAADLDRVPVSLIMPEDLAIAQTLIAAAHRAGVALADHSLQPSGLEGLGVGVDPAAHLAANRKPEDAVHAAGRRLVAARIVDLLRSGMRGAIGSSHDDRLDVTAYKVALSVNDYQRPIIIDARQWSDLWRGIEQSMRVWTDAT